jgi:hypothetical protein
MEEYARLAGKLPHVRCKNFEELCVPFPHQACKKCGESTLVIPIGKGARKMCRDCFEGAAFRRVTCADIALPRCLGQG